MDTSQLDEIATEIEALHKSMKNLIEIAFALSPLMLLSTQGWSWRNIHRVYLLRVSF
jgi:hypothetical protein